MYMCWLNETIWLNFQFQPAVMAPVATVEEVKVGDELHIVKPMKFKVSVTWQQIISVA